MGLLVADRSGNVGTFPRRCRTRAAPAPRRRPAALPGHAGVTVRRLAAAPPLTPVDAGKVAVVFVDARGRTYDWALRRLGDRRCSRTVDDSGARLRVRVPRGQSGALRADAARHGVGGYRTTVPLVVRTTKPRALLVVLPALTWQGRNPVDDDGDGMPNTLDCRRPRASALLTRPFAHGMPAGFAQGEGALLRFLDDNLLRYDLTTDAALASGEGPPLGTPPRRRAGGRPALDHAAAARQAAPLRARRRPRLVARRSTRCAARCGSTAASCARPSRAAADRRARRAPAPAARARERRGAGDDHDVRGGRARAVRGHERRVLRLRRATRRSRA